MAVNRPRTGTGTGRATRTTKTSSDAKPVRRTKKKESDASSADDDFGSGVDLPEDPSDRAAEPAVEAAEPKKRVARPRRKVAEPAPAASDDFGAEIEMPSYSPSREDYHDAEPEAEEAVAKPRRTRKKVADAAPPALVAVPAPVSKSSPEPDDGDDEEQGDDDSADGTATDASGEGGKKKRRRRRKKSKSDAPATTAAAPAPAPAPKEHHQHSPPKRPFERKSFDRGGYGGRPSGDRPAPNRNYPSAYEQRTGGFQNRSGYEGGGGGGGDYENRGGGYENRGGGGYENRGSSGYENRGGSGYENRGGGGGYENRGDNEYRQGQGQGGPGGPNRFDRFRNRGPTAKYQRNAPKSDVVSIEGAYSGVLELHPKGYGFLRDGENDYASREVDPFVSSQFVERHGLREGIVISGDVGPGSRGQGPRLNSIELIDGKSVEHYEGLKHFDTLTPVNPYEHIKLETGPTPLTMRVMDLLTPIGKGQRALIVAPPRTGKTMLLAEIAHAVTTNHPEIHLIMLLIDERPEEVTDMRRKVKGEVIASSMDRDVESHVRISQLIFERGKRLAEQGRDVVILMDSVTRAARAFNKWVTNTGRGRGIMSGGLDVKALDIPKKMFGTARRFEDGGSLTVVATALIDTNSKMDEVIFQEFKGTGNMELVLSRELADRRIWPSIDITKSGTRHEEKILAADQLEGIIMLRRALIAMSPVDAMNELTRKLAMFKTNKEFLERVRSVL